MKAFNEVLRFVLELVLLAVFAWFGWWLGDSFVTSALLAVVLVLAFCVPWGLLAAPKRRFATPGWVPGAMFVGYGAFAVAALAVLANPWVAAVLGVLVLTNESARLAGLEVADRG